MPTLAIFDLNESDTKERYIELAVMLDESGYQWNIEENGQYISVPNNSVFHLTKTPAEVVTELLDISKKLQIKPERIFATELLNHAYHGLN